MDELDREIALHESRTALALAMKIQTLRERGLLTDAQADRLAALLDEPDVEAAAEETARIMREAMERARIVEGRSA